MNNQALCNAFAILAACGTTQDLIHALRALVLRSFEGYDVNVYEIVSNRGVTKQSKGTLVYRSLFTLEVEGLLDERSSFYEAYASRTPVFNLSPVKDGELIVPVVLSDRSVSHLIMLKRDDEEIFQASLVSRIVLISASLFKNLHEKNYDQLTRVLNRQAFDNACSDPTLFGATASSRAGIPYGVIAILDIDFFKSVNDGFGHAIGDEVLVLFCQVIASAIRSEDKLFRYGGEEFVVFLRGDNLLDAEAVLQRCRAKVENKRFPQVGTITLSAGFTKILPKSHPLEQLLKADRALYFAKENGRNRVCCYEELLYANLIEPVSERAMQTEFWFSENKH